MLINPFVIVLVLLIMLLVAIDCAAYRIMNKIIHPDYEKSFTLKALIPGYSTYRMFSIFLNIINNPETLKEVLDEKAKDD